MIINTFHKKGKPQKVTVERLVHSAVSTDIHGKLTGKESCRRKRCTSNGDARCLEGIVNNLGEHHKEWTEAGVSAGDQMERGYKCHIPHVKPLLNQKCEGHLT